ncbi:hypothetical protein LTR78_010952 [Recurvomyces mirabilis]|uniref:Metallo-beta-lactamase domain-containing protein n=1 Tax=Recurvomyces mirabilis TaxID=574656 RepID=A0AAE0TR55_9PEZI|nr:hypothetical protein LTR78_010952 [Recurvomyces mirabilis]KAK5149469.1 hypothetical protein LTS14_010910 [Recurvomyces mirabilis]
MGFGDLNHGFTGTWQYIIGDQQTHHAAVIDSVLDYNKETGVIGSESADGLLEVIQTQGYQVQWILETHAHADHLSASRYIQESLIQRGQKAPLVGIGQRINQVQQTMADIYKIPQSELQNTFDQTFTDDSSFFIGALEARVVHLPGHTPDHVGYIIGHNIFTGDSMFNPDVGSARCDFPGGCATELYDSMQKLLAFPPDYRLYTGHDYPPKDRMIDGKVLSIPISYTTVGEQMASNKHVKTGTKKQDFVRWRAERDDTLSEPKLLRQSMHVNVRGGRLPATAVDGFKISSVPERVAFAKI